MNLLGRYNESLRNIPSPGGNGCHTAILGVANLGTMAGMQVQAIYDDIRRSIPAGTRRISDREIFDAINKAMQDHNGGTFTPQPRPAPIIQAGKSALQRIIDSAKISDEADLWECSPIRIDWPPEEDTFNAL